jgi:hypothetical protein
VDEGGVAAIVDLGFCRDDDTFSTACVSVHERWQRRRRFLGQQWAKAGIHDRRHFTWI